MDNKKQNSNELYHHGVPGMKWGQHIFGDIKKTSLNYFKRKNKEKNISRDTKLKIKKLKKLAKEEAQKRNFQKKQNNKIDNAKKHIFKKYGIDYGKDSTPNKEKPIRNNPLTKKQIKNLSDTELRERQNRLNNEKQLIELQNYHASIGQKFVRTLVKDVIVPAAVNAGKDLTTSYLKKYGEMSINAITEEMSKNKKKRNK